MFKPELKEKEIILTFDNEQHQLCWDGMVYTIREKTNRTVKTPEGESKVEDYFVPIAYYSNLGKCLDRMAELKLLEKKEYNTLSEIFNSMYNFKKNVVEEISDFFKNHYSRKNIID